LLKFGILTIHLGSEQVARTAGFAIRVFSVAIIATLPYSIVRQPVGGRVCRPTDRNSGVLFPSDRYFFIGVRLL
jgi:hypothetical protein